MYTCIDKIRNKKGVIQLYHLVNVDNTRDSIVLPSNKLKNLMLLDGIHINNLKLTSDNRIVDCKSNI